MHAEKKRPEKDRAAGSVKRDGAGQPSAVGHSSPRAVVALQRAAGNAAVTGMLQEQEGEAEVQPVRQSAVHGVLRSPGRPLDGPLRAEMEARLGSDFSDVRVHSGTEARRSAAEIGARAYTSGNHVVLGEGKADKHTLAHELTHVIQQRQGPVAGTDSGSGLMISDPSDRFERAAEENARRVMANAAPRVTERPSSAGGREVATVQRMDTHGDQEGDFGFGAVDVPQPKEVGDPERVGLEIELTVNLKERRNTGSAAQPKKAALKNGDVLAESGHMELDLPVIKLVVEGMQRQGQPSIELIYGPLPRAEYREQALLVARQKLIKEFEKRMTAEVPLAEVIGKYNSSLAGDETRYAMAVQEKGLRLETSRNKSGGRINQNMQTNVSLPYAKVGAAPPAPAEPASRGRGGSRGRGPAGAVRGQSRGRGASPAARGRGGSLSGRGAGPRPSAAPAAPARGDFTGLFREESDKRMFATARMGANGITDNAVRGHPNVLSLLTQVIYQTAKYHKNRIQKGGEGEGAKQHFDVLMKASPQDVIMTILDDQEALDLQGWLNEPNSKGTLDQAATAAARAGGATVMGTVRVDVADLTHALNLRWAAGRQQLEVREKDAEGEQSSAALHAQLGPIEDIRHFHPRASNRIPITVRDGDHYVVVEERDAKHPLNDPGVSAAEKNTFLRDLQRR